MELGSKLSGLNNMPPSDRSDDDIEFDLECARDRSVAAMICYCCHVLQSTNFCAFGDPIHRRRRHSPPNFALAFLLSQRTARRCFEAEALPILPLDINNKVIRGTISRAYIVDHECTTSISA